MKKLFLAVAVAAVVGVGLSCKRSAARFEQPPQTEGPVIEVEFEPDVIVAYEDRDR